MTNTKTHILMVSLKLFLQKNYKEVTLKEIVHETGLSKGAFYHYFESKEKLFFEIIDHFFAAILAYDFTRLPSRSLREFYSASAEKLNEQRFQFLSREDEEGEDFININFFSLLFDAFKLFPEFRTQMEQYHLKEMNAWKEVIKSARAAGEILSPLSDKQIAQIFLYSSDGLTMNLTMDCDSSELDKKLISLWDNFYMTIKNPS